MRTDFRGLHRLCGATHPDVDFGRVQRNVHGSTRSGVMLVVAMGSPSDELVIPSHEHLLQVTRTARYHSFGSPEGPWNEVWYVLHGYAQLAGRFGKTCAGLANESRLVVAPEGLSRFYSEGTRGDVAASWMTSDLREGEIADCISFLTRVDEVVRPSRKRDARVSVLGFSQGAATAARFCVLSQIEVRRLVLWAGGFPPDLDQGLARLRLREVDVVLVAGRSDPYLDEETIAQEFDRLQKVAPQARMERFQGGHRLQRQLLKQIAQG